MNDPTQMEHGAGILKTVLLRLRWNDQDGFVSYRGDGKWGFVTAGLPQVTPEELNALLELAGIVPDQIVPNGACVDCEFSVNGQERGYEKPCLTCSRPKHDNFQLRVL